MIIVAAVIPRRIPGGPELASPVEWWLPALTHQVPDRWPAATAEGCRG